MDKVRVNSYLTYFRTFNTYFTALLILSFVLHSRTETTILSYVDLTPPFALLVSLWVIYAAGRSYISPNSITVGAIRLLGPLLLVLAVMLEYLGLIGSVIDRTLMSYFFLVVIGLCSIAFVSCEEVADSGDQTRRESLFDLLRQSIGELSRMEKWYLGGVLVLAAGLRLHELSTHSLIADETIHLSVSEGIHTSLLPVLPSGLVYLRGFVYSYIVSASTFVFGANEFGLRFPSVVFGVILVCFGFLAGTVLFDRRTGLITSLLIAIDPFLLGFSRIGRFYILFYLLAVVTVVLFYTSFIENRTSRWAFESTAILSVLTHALSVLLFPLFLFWWVKTSSFDSSSDFPISDLPFLLTPLFVWVSYRGLRQYTYGRTIPGTAVSEITRPILGLNIYNVHFYWEVLVHPYTAFILLALPITGYVLYRTSTYRYSYEISYVSSCILLYLAVLGYVALRDNLRFVTVVVPFLLLLFARSISYLVENALSFLQDNDTKILLSPAKSSLFISIVVIALVTSNLFVGGVIIDVSYNLREIPEETESNWEVLEQHFRGNEYAFQAKVTHYLFINTKDAATYVQHHSERNPIVISTSNYGPVDTYVPVNYNANYYMSRYLGYRTDGTRYERYRGTPIITNVSMAESIFNSSRPIWIIADVRFEDFSRPDVEEYIKDNSRIVYVSSVSNSSKSTNVFGDRSTVRVYYSPPSDEKRNMS